MDLLTRLTSAVIRRPTLVLLASALALIPTLYLSSQLEFESSFTALLPDDYQAVKDLKAGIEQTGGSAFAVIAIEAHDRPTAERFADRLHDRLESLPIIRFVQSKLDIDFIEDRQLLYVDEARLEELLEKVSEEIDVRTIKGAGLDLGLDDAPTTTKAIDLHAAFLVEAKKTGLPTDSYMVGKDGKYLYVFAALKGDTGNLGWARTAQALLEKTSRELVAEGFPKDLELRFSGSLVIRLEEDAFLQSDLKKASGLGFAAVVLLLVAYTRRPRTLILLSAPLVVGIAFTFAFAELAIGRLNIISGFLASILSGLGIEFGIHLYLRHLEERGRGKDVDAAALDSTTTTGRSLVGSALTNAGAFFVVSFAGFQGFSEFGIIAGTGMLLTLAVTLLVFPALNVLLERIRPMKVPPIVEDQEGLHVPGWIQAIILIGMPLFFAFSVFQLAEGNVRFRTNWREIKGDSPASDFDDYIIESLGGSFTQSLVLVKAREDLKTVETAVDRVVAARKARKVSTGITGTLSLDDLIPPRQPERLSAIAKLRAELERIKPERIDPQDLPTYQRALPLTNVAPFDLRDVPESLKQRFMTAKGEGSLVILRTNYLFYESSQIVAWADEMEELRAELAKSALDTPIISENWLAGTVFKIIIGDGPFILGATLLIVFLVIFLVDFRSFKKAGLVLGSLLLGQVCIAGGMGLFGIELNFINAAVLPIIVGVSIDNAVHIYHRFLEDGPESIPKVLRYTASATSLSSATNLMGFGAMIVAHHKGLRSVAELAILGIAFTFVSTSVFFPLALGVIGKRQRAAAKS